MSKQLIEKWDELLEAEGKGVARVNDKEALSQLLENQENYVNENANTTADMAPFFPVLVPAVRRIFPGLLANEIVGVQPMNGPTGYAYAIRFRYGDGDGPTARGGATGYPAPFENAGLGRGVNTNGPNWQSYAIIYNDSPSMTNILSQVTDGTVTFSGTPTVIVGSAALATAMPYSEPGRALFNIGASGLALADVAVGQTFTITGDAVTALNGVVHTIDFSLGNEAGFNVIFKDYSGWMTTAEGEAKGTTGDYAARERDIKTMKMQLERVAAEAQTRKLKAEYTMELAQDLKNVHGLDAEQELINILEYEITAEVDRDLVARINSVAASAGTWTYAKSTDTISAGTNVSDGRWEQEKFRTLYTRIVKEANTIALTTRRGAGNFIIASTNVITALESLSSFMYSAVPGQLVKGAGIPRVGTLDGRFTVYCDTFTTLDYVTVGYKGPSSFDTGVVYMPYIPLMVQKVVDPNSFQPKVGFMQRAAIVENLFGARNYYRRFLVSFAGSSLEGSSLY